MRKEQGSRNNATKKERPSLISPFGDSVLAEIFQMGAAKYAPRNWEKGLPWMEVIDSLERHLGAFKKGEDFDPESKLLHMGHVAWNALAVVHFYYTRPEFDDRPHQYLHQPSIGLDVDDVIFDFIGSFKKLHELDDDINNWYFDYDFYPKLKALCKKTKANKEWWINLPTLIKPEDLPFEPTCYITSRGIPTEWTQIALQQAGFPTVPVHTVGIGNTKVEVAKKAGIDWFVDDHFKNFVELNKAGICCFLMDATHNRKYNVGYKRINSLSDLPIFS